MEELRTTECHTSALSVVDEEEEINEVKKMR